MCTRYSNLIGIRRYINSLLSYLTNCVVVALVVRSGLCCLHCSPCQTSKVRLTYKMVNTSVRARDSSAGFDPVQSRTACVQTTHTSGLYVRPGCTGCRYHPYVARSTVSGIVPRVVEAIYNKLQPFLMQVIFVLYA